VGINSLLVRPYNCQNFLTALETLVGLKFRRFKRKRVQFPLTLISKDGKSWHAKIKVINLECVLVIGKNLPPQGANVYLKGIDSDLPSFHLWVHCWRKVKNSLLLRFLNPKKEFLEAIEKLPAESSKKPNETALIPDYKNTQSSQLTLENPSYFCEIDVEALFPPLREWISGKEKTPPLWSPILNAVRHIERAWFLDTGEKDEELAKIFTLKLLLKAQCGEIQNKPLENKDLTQEYAQRIIQDHELKVKKACEIVQKHLLNNTKNADQVALLNQLKSDLQKFFLGIRQNISLQFGLEKNSSRLG